MDKPIFENLEENKYCNEQDSFVKKLEIKKSGHFKSNED